MIWSTTNSRIAQLIDFISSLAGYYFSLSAWLYLYKINPRVIPQPVYIDSLNQLIPALIIGSATVIYFWLSNAYSFQRFTSFSVELVIIFKVNLLLLVTTMFVTLAIGHNLPRTIFALFWSINIVIFFTQKTILFLFAAYIRTKGKDRKKILVVGSGNHSKKFLETVKDHLNWGLDVVGVLTDNREKIGSDFCGYVTVGVYDEIITFLRKYNPEEVIIAISSKRFDQIRAILDVCETEGVQVRIYSDFFGKMTKKTRLDHIHGLNILSFTPIKQTEVELIIKRIIDILGSSIALLLFFPLMIIASLGILISDGRPIIYNWNVIGLNKKPFKSWKFRTMIKNADQMKKDLIDLNEMDGPVFKIKNDPRIFPFGKLLRKWSIDETPQLFSILIGDMSLVGPRPAGPIELEGYESWHRRKLSVKPGLTCLWQVNGRNKISKFDDWVKLDLEYIDNWSLILDFKILLKTIPAVLFGRGAS